MNSRLERVAMELSSKFGSGAQGATEILKILNMNFSEKYLEDAACTDSKDYRAPRTRASESETIRLLHAAMGLTTEAGEVMDVLKKYIIYGKPMDKVNLAEELGDILWYVALVCNTVGLSFGQIQAMNIAKLKKRFPEAFQKNRAIKRDLDGEREILEQHFGPSDETKEKTLDKVDSMETM